MLTIVIIVGNSAITMTPNLPRGSANGRSSSGSEQPRQVRRRSAQVVGVFWGGSTLPPKAHNSGG